MSRQSLLALLLGIVLLSLVAYSQVASIVAVYAPENYVIGSKHRVTAVYELTPPRILVTDTTPTFTVYAWFMVVHGTDTFGQAFTTTTADAPVTITQLCLATIPSTIPPGISQVTYSVSAVFTDPLNDYRFTATNQTVSPATFIKILVSNGETITITAVEQNNTTQTAVTTTTIVNGKTYTITSWIHKPPHTIAHALYTAPPTLKIALVLVLLTTATAVAVLLIRRYA